MAAEDHYATYCPSLPLAGVLPTVAEGPDRSLMILHSTAHSPQAGQTARPRASFFCGGLLYVRPQPPSGFQHSHLSASSATTHLSMKLRIPRSRSTFTRAWSLSCR